MIDDDRLIFAIRENTKVPPMNQAEAAAFGARLQERIEQRPHRSWRLAPPLVGFGAAALLLIFFSLPSVFPTDVASRAKWAQEIFFLPALGDAPRDDFFPRDLEVLERLFLSS